MSDSLMRWPALLWLKKETTPCQSWHPLLFAVVATSAMTLMFNEAFFRALQQHIPGQFALQLSLLALVFLLNLLLVLILGQGRALKPVVLLLFLTGAAAAYFQHSFGVVLDKGMLQNALETDSAEASGLLSLDLIWHLAQWMAFPVLLSVVARIQVQTWRQQMLHSVAATAVVLLSIVALGATQFSELAPFFRNYRDVKHLALPVSPIVAASSLMAKQLKAAVPASFTVLGQDAVRTPLAAGQKPRLLVLVLGETARADHFALNGYPRNTTPLLNQLPVYSFATVSSCGTATAHSVPCMFSVQNRDNYDEAVAKNSSNVLDILAATGVDASWLDNNSGCKGVCDRLPSELLFERPDPRCTDGQCLDSVLLDAFRQALSQRLQAAHTDRIIVLHQLGSHGPEYFRRSADADKHFLPECTDKQIQLCAPEHIVNAYDNSIVATDQLLASVIAELGQHTDYDSAMLYLSDHGESLGENGVYLHGLPYWMAPEAQTHIPMIWWMSADEADAARLDKGCLKQQQQQPLSQDYLFHTLLGFFNLSTSLYQPKLDFLEPCRRGEV
ncbi:phosphoethanolamine--lipid A transferase [Rheinheimera sp.]|uniref:phosphoethanolamine transferase n=1 Tax=Rheinheimera sp. TaxID=1869214 RepID=UPI00307E22E4